MLETYNPPSRAAASPAPQDPALPRPRAGGARALARARRLPRVGAPPRGRRAVGLLRGPADRQRAARAPTTCSRACSRTSSPATRRCAGASSSARAAGTATACAVEIAVEQKLGFTSKDDIERYGIAEFNQQCRESVFEFLEDWTALTERIGYWVDLEHPYRTLDPAYIESVWWALKTMWEKDLLFEGHKVVPYCVRCGTALSSHEVAQGYQDVEDPSIYVTFPVTRAGRARCATATCCWRGRRRRGRCVSNAARRRRARPHLRPHRRRLRARRGARRARARRGRAGRRPLPRRGHARRALRAAVRLHQSVGVRRRRATPCCRATS